MHYNTHIYTKIMYYLETEIPNENEKIHQETTKE